MLLVKVGIPADGMLKNWQTYEIIEARKSVSWTASTSGLGQTFRSSCVSNTIEKKWAIRFTMRSWTRHLPLQSSSPTKTITDADLEAIVSR